jgi:integrase
MASIRKLPNGRYQAQFRPIPGGKQITRTGARRSDVQRWLDEQTAGIVTGAYVDPRAGRETLASFYATWSPRQVWETGTRRAVDLSLRTAPFRDESLQRITRAHIEEWVKAMQKAGLAPQTIKTRIMNIRTVLRAAVVDRKIPRDPTLGVKLPALRRPAASMRIPTTAQVRAILDGASDRYQPLFAVCAFAGLRLGEASALQLGDVDFLNRKISVRRQAQRGDRSALEVRLPKYGSEREIAAAPGLIDALAAHATALGLAGDDSAWLFPSDNGGPSAPSTVNSAWLSARGDLPYTLHDFRHFFASGLISAGCDVVTVQHALGHSKPSITLDTYSHLWPKAEDRTRSAAAALMGEVFGATDELLTIDSRASQ